MNSQAAANAAPLHDRDATVVPRRLELIATTALFGAAGSVLFSIAIAQSCLLIAALCWAGLLVWRGERVQAPRFFWPLLVYAGVTLVSAAFSSNPRASFMDSKQLILFLLVPITYRLMTASRSRWLL